ncbi:MAG: glycerophosphodiester phosphodiesterase [Microbacteriaceae bacterium]|nr:glycerophosphodiester phosphodiesterase [Microbacteriaceae bacterium]
MTGRVRSRRRAPASYLFPAAPRVLAHRGLAIEAPENTLLAFLRALALGLTHLEIDVRASRDGVAVISHDHSLERLTGRSIRLDALTMAELSEIDLGDEQTFCRLDEALDAFPDARFNIDIKSPDAVRPTVDAIIATGSIDRVLVTSFSEGRRRAAVRRLPGVASSASNSLFAVALLAGKLGLTPVVAFVLRGVDAVQVPERRHGIRIVTPRMLRLLHAAGVEVHVWTVNDVDDMVRLLDSGADGLVTDRADLAVRVVAQYRSDSRCGS